MTTYLRSLTLVLCLFVGSFSLSAHTDNTAAEISLFDWLSSVPELHMKLHVDLDELMANKNSNDFRALHMQFTDAQGVEQQIKGKVRVRGKYRRRVCTDMPPLKLDFSKKDLQERGLLPFDDFKLVTHCMDDGTSRDRIAREHLAYNIYASLSPVHFRTILCKVTYQDTESSRKITRYAILIEDMEELEHRTGMTNCDRCFNVVQEELDTQAQYKQAIFQYMIGNEDWSEHMIRNLKLMRNHDNNKLIPVPYDFDFSGLVNAYYALPNIDYGLTSVSQRYYSGPTHNDRILNETLDFFRQSEADILAVVATHPLLQKRSKREISVYLEGFFYELEQGVPFYRTATATR